MSNIGFLARKTKNTRGDENFEISSLTLGRIDNGFLLSPQTALTDCWCSKYSLGKSVQRLGDHYVKNVGVLSFNLTFQD